MLVGWDGEAGPVQRGKEPVARAVAGEHAAGPVRPVRRRRQADDHEAGVRVAEARHAAAPVGLAGVGRPPGPRHLLAPRHQARAAAAGRHVPLHRGQGVPGCPVGRHGAEPTMGVRAGSRPNNFFPPAHAPRPQGPAGDRRAPRAARDDARPPARSSRAGRPV